jgi:hypothetical protein
MASDVADPLAALSLLIAAFAVIFGLWQPTAAAALAMEPKRYRNIRNEQVAQAGNALWRMLTLAILALVVGLIFFQRACRIVVDACTIGGRYDDLATAFVVAEAIVLAIACLVGATAVRLSRLHARLDSPAEIVPS